MATTYYDAINDGETILSNTLDIGEDTSFVVNDGSQLPSGGAGTSGFIIKLEDTLGNREYIECSHRSGNTVYISNRGFEGTFARTWIAGSYLKNVFTKATKDEITNKILVTTDASITASTNSKTIEDKSGTIVLPRTKGEYVFYDNATSGLVATNVQDAIDELDVDIGDLLYTENNYILDNEPLTDSVDKLDIALNDVDEAFVSHVAELASKHIHSSGAGWIKFDDGLMICYGSNTINSVAVTTAVGTIYNSGFQSASFPQTFIVAPVFIVNLSGPSANRDSWIGHTTSTTTSGSIMVLSSRSVTINIVANWVAFGRWKA